jgi:hypothetical protein
VSDTQHLTGRFEVEIPAGWHKLPAEATAEVISAIVAMFAVDAEAGGRLTHALTAVAAVANSPRQQQRTHWALVPDPSAGRVEALLALGSIAGGAESVAKYLEAATVNLDGPDSDPANPAELVNRTVAERVLAVGRSVTVHDFVIEPASGGVADPAVERAIVAVFPERAARGIEMSIITQNLAWFDDITGYLVDIASTFRETEVRSA